MEIARLFVNDLDFDKQIIACDWSEEVSVWHSSLRKVAWDLVHNQVIVYENISFSK